MGVIYYIIIFIITGAIDVYISKEKLPRSENLIDAADYVLWPFLLQLRNVYI